MDANGWMPVVLLVREATAESTAVDLVVDAYGCGADASFVGIAAGRYPQALDATPFGRSILADAREIYARPDR